MVFESLQTKDAHTAAAHHESEPAEVTRQKEAMMDLLQQIELQYKEDAAGFADLAAEMQMQADDDNASSFSSSTGSSAAANEPVDDLAERMADIDLEAASADEIWERMSVSERAEFERAVADGRVANFAPFQPWLPWWSGPTTGSSSATHDEGEGASSSSSVPTGVSKSSRVLIEELSSNVNSDGLTATAEEGDDKEQGADSPDSLDEQPVAPTRAPTPKPLTNVPALSTLIGPGKQPAQELCFHLVDLVYAYAFAMRLHNGDTQGLVLPIAQAMLAVSGVLSANSVHHSVDAAIAVCVGNLAAYQRQSAGLQAPLKAESSEDAFTSSAGLEAMQDTSVILSSLPRIQSAIADMHAILTSAFPIPQKTTAKPQQAATAPTAQSKPTARQKTVNDLVHHHFQTPKSNTSSTATASSSHHARDTPLKKQSTPAASNNVAVKPQQTIRKVFFFASWANEALSDLACRVLAAAVSAEHAVRYRQAKLYRDAKAQVDEERERAKREQARAAVVQRMAPRPKLIQEL
ncbi:hypothetical protein CAOG_00234 [Capsaspora owczarzaki ATCC 30864]|nr:hypothetical protein CAOG_00234 [Capsaspora owczarzaki ATCC 30864]|eukprot:XP_004365105.1 hypothetical protein CAOG_00234 [Capsaspora owczarzaki ATCC 30864]